MKIVVAGIGQSLRGDDGAGLDAVRLWRDSFPATANRREIHVETEECPGLRLLDLLDGATSALLVDAVRTGAPPGTVHVAEEPDAVAFAPGSTSAHGWGVAETLAVGRSLAGPALPRTILLVGIEVEDLSPGAGLSRGVREALPAAARTIQEQVERLLEPIAPLPRRAIPRRPPASRPVS